jgi:DNA-directed RNA polymerase specialized sigma24 family protein
LAWGSGDDATFFGIAEGDLREVVLRVLARSHGVTYEEAEECWHEALQALVAMAPAARARVDNPHAYIWRCAKNAAADVHRERRDVVIVSLGDEEMHASPSETSPDYDEPSPFLIREELATYIVEGTLDQEVDGGPVGQCGAVVAEAVARLSPSLRRVTEHWLARNGDVNSTEMPSELGMSPVAYRVAKHRAFEALQRSIPDIARERGVSLRGVDVEVLKPPAGVPTAAEDV